MQIDRIEMFNLDIKRMFVKQFKSEKKQISFNTIKILNCKNFAIEYDNL